MKAARGVNYWGLPIGGGLWACMWRPQQRALWAALKATKGECKCARGRCAVGGLLSNSKSRVFLIIVAKWSFFAVTYVTFLIEMDLATFLSAPKIANNSWCWCGQRCETTDQRLVDVSLDVLYNLLSRLSLSRSDGGFDEGQ